MDPCYTYSCYIWMDRDEIGKHFGKCYIQATISKARKTRLVYKFGGAVLVTEWLVLTKKRICQDLTLSDGLC